MTALLSPAADICALQVESDCSPIFRLLASAGLSDFDSLWNLPHDFVEPVNYRRNGWSAVSRVNLPDGKGRESSFFLKRQENQKRYSWRYCTGALTYRYEVDALHKAELEHWPCVELVAFGFRKQGGVLQGMVLTRAIESDAFSCFEHNPPLWHEYLDQLTRAGRQLLRMHEMGWQHGALFPGHLFMDLASGTLTLIDFERARHRRSPEQAAIADLTQFLRRAHWLPDEALDALLSSYFNRMPAVIRHLSVRFPQRFRSLNWS